MSTGAYDDFLKAKEMAKGLVLQGFGPDNFQIKFLVGSKFDFQGSFSEKIQKEIDE